MKSPKALRSKGQWRARRRLVGLQGGLGKVDEGPGSSSGEPAVLRLSMAGSITAGDHLGVNIRLGAVNLTDAFNIRRAGLFINLKGTVSSSDNGFCNGNPGIVMAEDTAFSL